MTYEEFSDTGKAILIKKLFGKNPDDVAAFYEKHQEWIKDAYQFALGEMEDKGRRDVYADSLEALVSCIMLEY